MADPAPFRAVAHARVFLTSLVPLHHSNVSHGAAGFWPFRDPSLPAAFASPGLSAIAGVNQSFFMGEFFLLAGLFARRGAEKRGNGGYLKDRARRLAPPAIIYFVLVRPAALIIADAERAVLAAPSPGLVRFDPLREWLPGFAVALPAAARRVWDKDRATAGPMWFSFALMAFSAGFVGIRALFDREDAPEAKAPSPSPTRTSLVRTGALAYLLIVPPATLLTRLVFPLGLPPAPWVAAWLANARSRLEWQLGYFPGFITAYALGCIGGRHLDVLFPAGPDADPTTSALASRLLLLSLAAFPMLPLLGLLGYAGDLPRFTRLSFGGLNPAAAAYAAWEPFLGVGIVTWSLFGRWPTPLARAWEALPTSIRTGISRLLSAMDRSSMATYALHAVPTVLASVVLPHAVASAGWDWKGLSTGMRAGMAGVTSILGSWAVGIAAGAVPGAGNVF
ncbi:hypothetical protein DFJ74DRAFT_683860 [Hyaloraphidium curvatum]|nr:hypothetical protein DFJ74DRAFT_683860 [Hyaloraphidium curvatum]